MKKQILIIVILLFTVTLFAQKTEKQSKTLSKHAVGVAAGPTIGYGLSYQYTYSRFSVQATFFPRKTSNHEIYYTGLTFYYVLVKDKKINLFLYQGNNLFCTKVEENWKDWNRNEERKKYFKAYNNNGLGIGFEFVIVEHVSLKLMSGYAYYLNFKKLSLTGEIALLYHIPSK